MYHKEQKLSDYIDKLNADQNPEACESSTDSSELKELFNTVRLVHSLKEPTMPEADYPKKLTDAVNHQFSQSKSIKNKKRVWFTGLASVAAILVMAIMMNFFSPLDERSIAYAMEEAFKEIKAYHGVLEIISTNAENKEMTQAKLEVWANQEGHYYTKGLDGSQKDIITVNNGQKKWQVQPNKQQVHILPVFPDSYSFTFELGKEIETIKDALSTKIIGEDIIAGRQTSILEVSAQGGSPYRIWIDQETNLPMKKQYEMHNGLQYTITYSEMEFSNAIPEELVVYHVPNEFEEINNYPEQLINDLGEAQAAVGFIPEISKNISTRFTQDSIAIIPKKKLIKLYYTMTDKKQKVILMQGKSISELNPSSTAIIGEINNNIVEIQSPIYEDLGILGGGGLYSGLTDISSIRWQEDGFEYVVLGNASIEELTAFVEGLTGNELVIPSLDKHSWTKAQVQVPVDLDTEENVQKSVDGGSSPWRLDPSFVAQVFVSLQISPEGIAGEYPIKLEDLEVIQNDGKDSIIEVRGDSTPTKRVYLKKLVRQDSTGIWTVVGYDPINN